MTGITVYVCALALDVPKNAANIGSTLLRMAVFEPLARAGRYLLALSLIVFGVDHFLALIGVGEPLAGWIPWHVFWVAFFGAVFIAGGLSMASIACNSGAPRVLA